MIEVRASEERHLDETGRAIDVEGLASEIIRIRLSQLIINERYKSGSFRVPIHLALGHEALAVAINTVISDGDRLLLSHRNIAYNLARARGVRPVLHEYQLLPTGLGSGRYGSMNLANPDRGIVYTSSILGNQFPVAVGVALGEKLSDDGGLVMVLAGDGSIEEGVIYESAVMARGLDLPVVFLVENNEWSMATKIDERRRPIDLASFADACGLSYERLSGNDPVEYVRRLGLIRRICLEKCQPVVVEAIVTTLGDSRAPSSPQHPQGRFINYHAGPAATVSLTDWPVIKNSSEDPLWVLLSHLPEQKLRFIASEQLRAIELEVV